MDRVWIVTGGLAGFGAVGMAAAGSHVLTGRLDPAALHWVDVAVQMQGWHALALVLCGVWAGRAGGLSRVLARVAGASFLLGTVLFCGALYVLALAGASLGPAAPAGGLCLMAGWLLLAASGGAAVLIRSTYLAAEGFEAPLEAELARRGVAVAWHGRLAVSDSAPVACAWAQDTWLDPREAPAPSIKAAADALRAVQRNWAAAEAPGQHRRMALVAERLPPVRARPLRFPEAAPAAHLGAWTLLAPDRLLFSPRTGSPFPRGECRFDEDREGPPSRAYLKAWEAWTRWGVHPGPGERCIDLGAAPGGWTWAAAMLGAGVLAVDKAPLDPAVAALPGVAERRDSAFALDPGEWGAAPFDWLLCDVIAYPARSLALVQRWIGAGAARRVVCTLKFQGETDHDTADAFAAIPGGRVQHLFHNKHELTFTWPHEEAP